MTKFAANNMRVGTSRFALTPANKLYWLSSKHSYGPSGEDSDLVLTTDIKMGFITSVQEKGGAYLKIGDNCSAIAPELDLFTVRGFYYDDEWECYQIEIEPNA